MGRDTYNNRGKSRNFYTSHRKRYNFVPNFEFCNSNYFVNNVYNPWIPQNYKTRGGHSVRKKIKTPISRPPSPLCGTEEYTQRKIQKVSDLIKKQLLGGEESIIKTSPAFNKHNIKQEESPRGTSKSKNLKKINNTKPTTSSNKMREKETISTASKMAQNISSYDLQDIHDKIINHILNLNYGRKMNLINATSSGYDAAIQQIQKQKRLELSRALRNMCSNDCNIGSAEVINAVIPDIGIKIEDLPKEVIEKISSTLDFNIELQETENNCFNCIDPSDIKTEPSDMDFDCKENNFEKNCDQLLDKNKTLEESNSFSFLKEFDNLVKNSTDQVSYRLSGAGSSFNIQNEEIARIALENTKNQETGSVGYKYWLSNSPRTSKNESIYAENTATIINESKSDTKSILERTKKILQVIATPTKRTISKKNNGLEENSGRSSFTEENKINLNEIIKTNSPEMCSQTIEHSRNNHFCATISTQTDDIFNETPKTLEEAISLMFKIDTEINKLTTLRQNIFSNLSRETKLGTNNPSENFKLRDPVAVEEEIVPSVGVDVFHEKEQDKRIINKRKNVKNKKWMQRKMSKLQNNTKSLRNNSFLSHNSEMDSILSQYKDQKMSLDFKLGVDLHEKVLVIESTANTLLVGSESGKIYFFSLLTGKLIHTLEVAPLPITSVSFWKPDGKSSILHVGCLEPNLKVYNFFSKRLIETIELGDSPQCIEKAWGYLFIGCNHGNLYRYCLKKEKVEFQDTISSSNILVLKATKEGARRVLLVGTRNAAVCVRDAMSGLHMRTMEDIISPTVYSLLLQDSTVYCGTTSHDILVFNFHDGKLEEKLNASNAKGIGCMKLVRNLLYASCYDGHIYVYQTKPRRFVGQIQGPGGIILSMNIVDRKIFVGTMSFKFEAIDIPPHILSHVEEN